MKSWTRGMVVLKFFPPSSWMFSATKSGRCTLRTCRTVSCGRVAKPQHARECIHAPAAQSRSPGARQAAMERKNRSACSQPHTHQGRQACVWVKRISWSTNLLKERPQVGGDEKHVGHTLVCTTHAHTTSAHTHTVAGMGCGAAQAQLRKRKLANLIGRRCVRRLPRTLCDHPPARTAPHMSTHTPPVLPSPARIAQVGLTEQAWRTIAASAHTASPEYSQWVAALHACLNMPRRSSVDMQGRRIDAFAAKAPFAATLAKLLVQVRGVDLLVSLFL